MQATSYHNINMPKLQTSLNPEWKIEHEFISKSSRDFAHCVYLWNVYLFIFRIHYLFIYVFLLLPEVQKLCFLALCQIICLFMYLFYFQKSRNVMFSGTVPDYLFIYVFILLPEVQKCYVFWHCARLFVYLFIYCTSRSPEMLCFQALCTLQDRFILVVSFFKTDITMSWINTNTLNKHFFASSVTYRYTSRYIW